MKLSEIEISNIVVFRDGYFDCLSQCTVEANKNILSFLTNGKYIDLILNNSNITCIICNESDLETFSKTNKGIIISENPQLTFFMIHNFLSLKHDFILTKINSSSIISDSAAISKYNVEIGENVIIEDNVVIKENVYIGRDSIIRSGCVIGGEGFEFKRNEDKNILDVKHMGKVIIGSNVELKEFVTVHQAVFNWDYTQIDDYCKLDAHTHVGHATKIGKRVLIGSHSNLAGNIDIGDDVYIGPGVSISNRLKIGFKSKVSIGSVVTKDVKSNSVVSGNFAIDHSSFISFIKSIR